MIISLISVMHFSSHT